MNKVLSRHTIYHTMVKSWYLSIVDIDTHALWLHFTGGGYTPTLTHAHRSTSVQAYMYNLIYMWSEGHRIAHVEGLSYSLQWTIGVPNHRKSSYLFNSLFKFATKKHTEPRVTAPLCGEIHRWPVGSSHKGPVTRKMFPRHNVFMYHASRVEWHAAIASE